MSLNVNSYIENGDIHLLAIFLSRSLWLSVKGPLQGSPLVSSTGSRSKNLTQFSLFPGNPDRDSGPERL